MDAIRAGEGLFTALIYLAASVIDMYLNAVESLCSFVSSEDFTPAHLIILLINFILGRQYKDALSEEIRHQMEALERALDEEFGAWEGEHCKPSTRAMAKTGRRMACTTIDMAMVSASGQCSICLQEFQEGQRGKLMPECHHLFHPVCIDEWLIIHSSCPLCRSRVF